MAVCVCVCMSIRVSRRATEQWNGTRPVSRKDLAEHTLLHATSCIYCGILSRLLSLSAGQSVLTHLVPRAPLPASQSTLAYKFTSQSALTTSNSPRLSLEPYRPPCPVTRDRRYSWQMWMRNLYSRQLNNSSFNLARTLQNCMREYRDCKKTIQWGQQH